MYLLWGINYILPFLSPINGKTMKLTGKSPARHVIPYNETKTEEDEGYTVRWVERTHHNRWGMSVIDQLSEPQLALVMAHIWEDERLKETQMKKKKLKKQIEKGERWGKRPRVCNDKLKIQDLKITPF